MNKARLYLRTQNQHLQQDPGFSPNDNFSQPDGRNSGGLRCYEIYWQAINPEFKLKDCYSLGLGGGGHFYGGGEIPGRDHFSLNKTSVPYSPFLTGNKVLSGVNAYYIVISNILGFYSVIDNCSLFYIDSDGRFHFGRTLGRFFVNSEGLPKLCLMKGFKNIKTINYAIQELPSKSQTTHLSTSQ